MTLVVDAALAAFDGAILRNGLCDLAEARYAHVLSQSNLGPFRWRSSSLPGGQT